MTNEAIPPNAIRISPQVELEIVARERDQHRERALIYAELLSQARQENTALKARIAELEPPAADASSPPLEGELMEPKKRTPSAPQKH